MTARFVRSCALAGAAVFAAIVGSYGSAHSQTVVLDEGTFRLSIRGTPVGTETFSIRRSGEGANATIVAQGHIVLDSGQQTQSLIRTEGTQLRPTVYQIEVTGSDRQSISGQAAGNRFRATIVSTAGEQMREYLASEGAVVLDNGVAHQHFFLISTLPASGRVPIIIPRQSRQVSARVTDAGAEEITIDGRSLQARRIRVEPQGMATRILWVDDQDRVLRLRIPDDEFLAERTTLP